MAVAVVVVVAVGGWLDGRGWGQVRHGEEKALQQLASHVPLTNERVKYTDPHTKAYLLLQVMIDLILSLAIIVSVFL